MSSQRSNIQSFIVMDMMAEASRLTKEGKNVMRLEAGAPDATPPAAIMQQLAQKLTQRNFGYTDSGGTQSLKKKVAWLYHHRHNLTIDDDDILITCGSSAGLTLAFLAAFDVGDSIAIPRPGYPAYRQIAHALGLQVVDVPLTPQNGWLLSIDDLKKLPSHPQGLIITNPANPTGAMLDESSLKAIARHCDDHGIRIISDEIYHDITYEEDASTIRTVSEHAIVVSGFSKFFAMPGWRLGWLVAPKVMRSSLLHLQQNLYVAPSGAGQELALAMLDENTINQMKSHVKRWDHNRHLLLKMIHQSPLQCQNEPKGGLYIYCDSSRITDDSTSWCKQLLKEHYIALAPGEDFDHKNGKKFIRFSFCRPTEEVERAICLLPKILSSS